MQAYTNQTGSSQEEACKQPGERYHATASLGKCTRQLLFPPHLQWSGWVTAAREHWPTQMAVMETQQLGQRKAHTLCSTHATTHGFSSLLSYGLKHVQAAGCTLASQVPTGRLNRLASRSLQARTQEPTTISDFPSFNPSIKNGSRWIDQ